MMCQAVFHLKYVCNFVVNKGQEANSDVFRPLSAWALKKQARRISLPILNKGGCMKKYIRAKTLAKILGVSKSTIWRWVAEGRLPKPYRPTSRTSLFDVGACLDALEGTQEEQV